MNIMVLIAGVNDGTRVPKRDTIVFVFAFMFCKDC